MFVEHEHGFFIVDGVNGAERQGTITIGYENGIARDPCCSFVSVGECLYVRQKHQGKKCFFKNILFPVNQVASVLKGFPNLKFVVKRTVVGACDADSPMTKVSFNAQFFCQNGMNVLALLSAIDKEPVVAVFPKFGGQ